MPEQMSSQPESRKVSIDINRRTVLGCAAVVITGAAGGAALNAAFPGPTFGEPDIKPDTPVYDAKTAKLAFVVDTSKCIGCGLCVVACKEENHIPEEAQYNRTWIERHVETADGKVHVDSPNAGISGFGSAAEAPGVNGQKIDRAFFAARLCMQCENPPCVDVCPVSATYQTEEGIVLVDESRCIGCGYCVTACPYGARYVLPAGQHTPLGAAGVADKCTWCYHRITRGLQPACVEVCPTGTRSFGNAANPDDPINAKLAEHPVPLWPDYGTKPQVLYLGPLTEEA